jgi:hypothetical protein
MYDLNPSPQKRSSLPAQVAAFEEDEVQETSVAEETEDMVPETSQVQPEADVPGNLAQSDVIAVPDEGPAAGVTVNMPMSPMQARRSDASSTTGKKRGRSPRRRSGESAASAQPSDVGTAEIEEAAEPSAINTKPKPKIRSKKEHPTATNIESGDKVLVPKKRRKLNGPKTMDPDATEAEVELAIPNATVRHNAQPRGDPQPEVRVPIKTTRLRIAEAEAAKANDTSATAIVAAASEQPEEPVASFSRTTMTRKAVSRPTKRKATRKTAPLEDGGESGRVDDRDVEDGPQSTDQQTQSDLTDFGNRDEVIENNDVAKNDDGHESGHAQEEYEDEEQGQGDEEHQEQDAEDAESSAARMPIEQWRALSDLEKVLHFKDQVAVRTGVCSTVVGRNIHRACDRARVILSKTGGPSLEDLRMCMTDVTEKLERIGSRVGSDSRTNFKGDAFRYLFRSLVVVFEQIYDLLRSREGEVTQSLAAMQILHPFVHAMRKFKDAMNAWPVRDLQREKGENRLFLDVESYLIVPLRAVEKDFHIQLGVLENAEQNRQTHRNFRREGHEQEYEETTRKIATSDATKQRRKRWQDLHIVRMQCEPDPSRRRRLRFVEPIEVVETDANGDRFERVPFFGERSAPPPRWTAASSGREWTKEQETVLLDALQSSLCKFVNRVIPDFTPLTVYL